MQTDDLQLKQIQAGNQAARKKLQSFRSGLQKMMKKPKKNNKYQPPSHDTKTQINQNQYYSTNSANLANSQLNSNPIQNGNQFGFNSTLFRQIGDETVVLSNSSGVNNMQFNSRSPYNSVPNTAAYYSTSSQQSANVYQPKVINNDSQTFKSSTKLFSEIDEYMNNINKRTKLPVKSIQKYFDKIQNNLSTSNVQDFNLHLSKSATKFNQQIKLSPKKQNKSGNKLKNYEEIVDEKRKKSLSAKDQIKRATNFLKSFKQRSDFMKAPPLPSPSQKQQSNKKLYQYQIKQKQKINKNDKNVKSKGNNYIQDSELHLNKTSKSSSKIQLLQNSVQIHRNKIKQTLNERKKIIKQQGMLDDSIDLQLSEQDQNQQGQMINRNDNNNKQQQQIKRLQGQKYNLLRQLRQIQQQLQKLQNE